MQQRYAFFYNRKHTFRIVVFYYFILKKNRLPSEPFIIIAQNAHNIVDTNVQPVNKQN